jgi:preprotein translocase subunit SecA
VVPTNKPMIRKDESDVVFRAAMGKWQATVVEISRMHKTGRGTDIILGGNAEFMAKLKLHELLMPRIVNTVDEMQFERKQKSPLRKNWKVNENLFPCKLSQDSLSLVEDAVQMPVRTICKPCLHIVDTIIPLNKLRPSFLIFRRKWC